MFYSCQPPDPHTHPLPSFAWQPIAALLPPILSLLAALKEKGQNVDVHPIDNQVTHCGVHCYTDVKPMRKITSRENPCQRHHNAHCTNHTGRIQSAWEAAVGLNLQLK